MFDKNHHCLVYTTNKLSLPLLLVFALGTQSIHLSFYALAPLTKCPIVTTALCHLPSSLMKKVRECSAQFHLLPPDAIVLKWF